MFGGASCGTGINLRMSNAEVGNLPRSLSSAIIPILFCSDCFVGVVAVVAVCSACCFRKGFGLVFPRSHRHITGPFVYVVVVVAVVVG